MAAVTGTASPLAPTETATVWSLLEAIRADPERSTVPRRPRTLTVHKPWGWLVWQGAPLQPTNPDDDDRRREPRPIMDFAVEWGLILHAVNYAVRKVPPPTAGIFDVDELVVDVPFELSDLEYQVAQTWLGLATPVRINMGPGEDPDRPGVGDGRHRLWLTSAHHGWLGVPVFNDALDLIGYHFKGQEEARRLSAAMALTLEDAVTWWEACPDPATRSPLSREHLRTMALAYFAVTDPAPVTRDWFLRWASWDDHIERLAELHEAGRTNDMLLRKTLVRAWRDKQDRTHIDPATLRSMFASLGFTVNGFPTARPRGCWLTLYRGATTAGKAGPSWTASPDAADHFAHNRQELGATAVVWQIRVHSSRVLAVITDEDECILDLNPDDLASIQPASKGARTARRTQRWIRRAGRDVPGHIYYPTS